VCHGMLVALIVKGRAWLRWYGRLVMRWSRWLWNAKASQAGIHRTAIYRTFPLGRAAWEGWERKADISTLKLARCIFCFKTRLSRKLDDHIIWRVLADLGLLIVRILSLKILKCRKIRRLTKRPRMIPRDTQSSPLILLWRPCPLNLIIPLSCPIDVRRIKVKNIFQPNRLDHQDIHLSTPYAPAITLRPLFLMCLPNPSLNSLNRLKRSRPNKCPSSLPTLMTTRPLEKIFCSYHNSCWRRSWSVYNVSNISYLLVTVQAVYLYFMPLVRSFALCLILHCTFIGSRCRICSLGYCISLVGNLDVESVW